MSSPVRKPRAVGFRHPVWSSYGPWILGGIAEFLRGTDSWRIATENDSFGEMEAVKIDRHWRGDGLVLFRATEEELQDFKDRGMAVVLTSTEGPDLGFPRVVPDNALIGRLAAEHLIGCAVPHFAFLARGETFYREEQFASGLRRYARERLGGFRKRLAVDSKEPEVHYLRGRPLWKAQTWREVETEVAAFLDLLPKPCGLFVVDDSLGAVALRAADRLGLAVPQDLAVIGFGNDPAYCYASYPALSTIAYPAHEIGREAARLLSAQMAGQPVPDRVEVSVEAVLSRDSSDMLAIADPEVRELVRYIRLTAPHEIVRVAELADRSSRSLTTLKTKFAAALGHGPKHEIQRVRLEHLKRLLAERSLTLAEIARRMKFGSAHELSRFFHGATGLRPGDYRRSLVTVASDEERQGVIFDMDGTLFDTEPIYFQAYRDAYAALGGSLSWQQYAEELLGTTNAHIEDWLAGRLGAALDLPAFRRAWRERWQELMSETPLEPLPGVRAWLESLCEDGIPVGLASSSDRADVERCLAAAGLEGYFSVTATGDEVAAGKPAPDLYLLACRRLGLPPAGCLAVEDSSRGVQAAQAAGLSVVWVRREGAPQAAAPVPAGVILSTSLAELDWPPLLGRAVAPQAVTAP